MSQTCVSAKQCTWPQCDCQTPLYPWASRNHGIARKGWEARFQLRILQKARGPDGEQLSPEQLEETVAPELEAWPEAGDPHNGPDWMWTLPEEAADEQMGNWLDDQEP